MNLICYAEEKPHCNFIYVGFCKIQITYTDRISSLVA